MRRSLLRAVCPRPKSIPSRRRLSDLKPGSPPLSKQAAAQSRLDRIVSRTPRFLQPALKGLRRAPVSHVTAFFILHELTAVIPLFGLAGAFHYWHWLPPYFAEGAWISAGVERFSRYFRRKGWITEIEEAEVQAETKHDNASSFEEQKSTTTRWVVELATAYAIVKVLLPARIFVSALGAPWFARITIIPARNAMAAVFRRTKQVPPK